MGTSGIVAVISKLDSGDASIIDNYILDDLGYDYEKLKNDPDFTVIGHITDKSSGANFVVNDGTVQELTAQGWSPIS